MAYEPIGLDDLDAMDREVAEAYANGTPPPPPPPGAAQDGERAKFAEQVIAIVQETAKLFHDPKGTAFGVVRMDGRRAVLRLASRAMKSWIAKTARMSLGKSVGGAAIDEALMVLEGMARFDCEERPVYVRVAEHEGAIYVDLGDETGACVEVTSKCWAIRDEAPVMFRRPDAMRPLPRPVRGGGLDELRPFFNGADDDAHYLFAAWLVATLRPGRPFPILALHGEQGTAKSTASRVARALVDPNVAPVRSVPRTEDDLAVATVHSHVIAFDNLSGVPPWLSDALCRLATGGGLSKRTLYADDEETIIEATRPIVVNGIDDLANRADLAERCLMLTLRPIPKTKRRDEATFWRAFEVAAPRILGVLLDGAASALRNLSTVQIAELPRMADFAVWIAAAEPGLGLPPGTLLGAYERNRARVVDVALDASPVATAVRMLLDRPAQGGRWEGTPDQCLSALTNLVPDTTRRSHGWPNGARGLSSTLRRSATFLQTVGVTLDLDGHEGRGADKHRVYRLAKIEVSSTTVPTVPTPPVAENKPRGGDAAPDPDRPQDRPHDGPRTGGDEVGSQEASQPTPPEARENGCGGRGDAGVDVAATSPGEASEPAWCIFCGRGRCSCDDDPDSLEG
jgi:hypothetical protein